MVSKNRFSTRRKPYVLCRSSLSPGSPSFSRRRRRNPEVPRPQDGPGGGALVTTKAGPSLRCREKCLEDMYVSFEMCLECLSKLVLENVCGTSRRHSRTQPMSQRPFRTRKMLQKPVANVSKTLSNLRHALPRDNQKLSHAVVKNILEPFSCLCLDKSGLNTFGAIALFAPSLHI